MRIASRMTMLAPEGAFAVLAKAQELERKGEKIVHFEIGQPDFPTPRHIAQAGITAIKSGKTYYTPSLGIHDLRVAIASRYRVMRYAPVDYQQVAVTPSGKAALFTAFATIINPGDEVLYPNPGFPAYKILIEFFGGKAVPIPLVEKRNFSFDMEVIRKKISKKTKVIIINSPNNPTGGIVPEEDLHEIASLAYEYKTWVVSDEIYNQILYTGKPYISIYNMPKMRAQTIVADGFSKSYAMTGWRLGYLVAPKIIMKRIDYFLTNSVACSPSFIQEAGVVALNGSQLHLKKMVTELKRRRNFVVKQLNAIPGVTCLVPDGAFYAFPNIKKFKKSSKEIGDYLLKDAKVALLDGTSFGQYGEGYLRISYSTDMKTLALGIQRIKTSLQKLL